MSTVVLISLIMGIMVGIGTVVGFIFKGWTQIKKLRKHLRRRRRQAIVEAISETLDSKLAAQDQRTDQRIAVFGTQLTEVLDVVHKEVTYNSGTSLKDTARRIETKVMGLELQVQAVDGKITGLVSRADAGAERARVLEGRVDRLEKASK